MIALSFSKIATVACTAIICIGLVGCSGAVSRPATTAGQQPSQPPAGEPPAGAQLSLSAAASDSRPSAGAQFILSATVTNDGEGTLPAVTLSYYRSTDATITTADTEVGTGAVAGLAASGSASASVVLTASATPGTYYYGACVDPVTDESDTTSNCSAAVQVNVLAAEPAEPPMQAQPDLAVASPSVSDRDPAAGTQFTLSVTVRNAGDAAAAATTLRYYRSTDATITTSDTEVATDEVAALAASGSSSESIDVTAPATAGTYYYGACVDPVTGESDITNNCSSSVPVTVSELDLVVATPTVSDSVPAAGATFTLSVRVESAGDGAAATTTLSIYRSTDATITSSDTLVGTVVAELATSATSSQSTRLAASTSPGAYYFGEVELPAPDTPGTYYYGACVDAVTDGADATDNCSPPAQVVVTEPDLVVAAPSVSDSGPTAGATFTLSARVRNDGEGATAATTLRFYRSTDATITTSDTEEGSVTVAALAASGTTTKEMDATAPSSPGTYYYGACVDAVTAESDITNNCSTSVPVTVPEPDKPDLKIYAVVAATNPFGGTGPGGLIQLSVGLRNDGDAAAAATTLRFFRSTDATITTSDTEEGTVEVAALAASGTTSEEIDVNAPSTTGTYYYGACVEAVTDESDTTNNCSTSVQVTVTKPAPDLVVAAPTVRDSGPAAGATFTLSTIVRNDGDEAAAATTLRFYRSTDATIATSDTEVGTHAVAGLAASGTSRQSVDLTAPDTSGTYYYGACVDAVTGESDTTNNCSASVQVTVPEPAPDQVAAEVAPSPSAAGAGNGEFYMHWIPSGDGGSAITKYQYRVWETGQTAPATWTDISLSDAALYTQDGKTVFSATGTGITTFDHRDRTLPSGYTVELRAVNTVGPGTAASATLTPATYWFEIEPLSWDDASIDTYPVLVYEGSEVRFRLHVKHNIPNGHVVQANSGFDEPFTLGLAITDTDNALAGSPPSSVLFARNDTSEDVTLQVAEDDVGADDKEVTLALSSTMTSPSNVFLGRFPPSVPFIVYDNEGPPSTPTNLTASPGDGQVTLTWTTPAGSVASTKHQYCRRTDSAACTVLNWRDIPNSGTGATNANSYTVKRLQNGTEYTFRVRAVHAGGESGVSNEAIATPQAQEPAPDLVVATPTVSDSGPDAGATFTLSATVRNDGEGASAATTLRYYRSTDATITTSDTEEGSVAVAALAASGTTTKEMDATAPSSPGTYYYGACVDAVTAESDITNNCSTSVPVTVPEPDKPDLKIYAVVAGTNPFDGTVPGGLIQLSVGLRNDGDAAAAATMLRFYRSTDAMITTSDTEEGSVAVAALAAAGTTTKEMDVTAPSSPGTYYYGACVDVVTGESDTTNNCSTSVEVTVAQPKSDLVVGEPSVDDDEPAAGASFTLSATVENEGGVAAAATTLRYYRSADATITMSDTEVVTDAIAGLAASASSSQSVELTAPSAPGTYYYGACVDAVTGESDTTNNCSSSVQVTVPAPSASEPTAPDQVAAEVAPSPSAAGAGNGEFYVHWIPSGDGGSAITKYLYRVWETGQTAPATWTDISLSDAALYTQDGKTVFNATGTGITTFDHRDRTLPSGYTVELRAVNTVGPGTAASATLTPATYWFEIEPLSWDDASIDTYPVLVYEGSEVRFRLHVKHNIPNGHVVQANSGFDEPFTLGLAITDTDNALAGSPPSSVLFAGNDTSEDVTLQVAEDDVGADDKEVTLALSSTTTSPSNVFLGRRPPSVPFIVYDNEGPPSTPTNLTASPGDGQVTLTWTTPAGSVASTKHQYCRRTDSAACTVLNWRDILNSGTGATNANSYTVTRLQNGTEYTFRVRAVHAGGKSAASDQATATPQVPEPAPDLVVATPTVSDSDPDAGATFTLSATVRNDGDEASAATTLRYYRSTGRIITTSDTEVGTDEVGALAALGTSDESVSLTATLPARDVLLRGVCGRRDG